MSSHTHSEVHDLPIKSFYPLVNLRLISHSKYHRVKHRIHMQAQKAMHSESIPKLPALDEEKRPGKRALLNSSLPSLALGLRRDEEFRRFEGISLKSKNFWPKKLTKVRKDFLAFDEIRRRNLTLLEASLLL